jgi:predicted Fe-S protein YdhL (DUF1289 family)
MNKYDKLLTLSRKIIEELDTSIDNPIAKAKLVKYRDSIELLDPVVLSPCVKRCKLVDETCVGCFRTMDEIAKWTYLSNNERLTVIENCRKRKEVHDIQLST